MKVIIRDLAVEYNDAGNGPVLLFLHGWGSSSEAFKDLIKSLEVDYRVLSIDFPGFGKSEQPKEDWNITDYAHFVSDFLQKVTGNKQCYGVFGHSFGGRVIIKSIAHELIRPEKVVLMGAAGIKPKKTIKQHAYKAIAKTGKAATSLPGLRQLASPLRAKLYGAIGSTDYLNSGTMKNIFLNTINEDLRADAAKNNHPTLLLWGSEDTETPVAQGQELNRLMDKSSLEVLSNAGHYVFIDQSEIVKTKIKEFLNA